jgi:DNA-binding CsgD family transcriptional regulator
MRGGWLGQSDSDAPARRRPALHPLQVHLAAFRRGRSRGKNQQGADRARVSGDGVPKDLTVTYKAKRTAHVSNLRLVSPKGNSTSERQHIWRVNTTCAGPRTVAPQDAALSQLVFSMYQSIDGMPNRHVYSPTKWSMIESRFELSPRELEIVQSIFDDHTEQRIARRLQISRHTVHTYFERVFRKLGVRSRTQLVVRVVHENRREAQSRCPLNS